MVVLLYMVPATPTSIHPPTQHPPGLPDNYRPYPLPCIAYFTHQIHPSYSPFPFLPWPPTLIVPPPPFPSGTSFPYLCHLLRPSFDRNPPPPLPAGQLLLPLRWLPISTPASSVTPPRLPGCYLSRKFLVYPCHQGIRVLLLCMRHFI